jgi:Kazal-type serine protease inhibitor domain
MPQQRRILVIAVILVAAGTAALAQPAGGTLSSNACACPKNINPVCVGGRRFDTPCLAECAGERHHSPCATATTLTAPAGARPTAGPSAAAGADGGGSGAACECSREYAPVCGIDGSFFPNRCLAKCIGTTVSDKPPRDGRCSYISSSNDSDTVPSPSVARPSAGVLPSPVPIMQPSGNTRTSCSCGDGLVLVCGRSTSGQLQTFANACTAACLRAQVLSQGACGGGTAVPAGSTVPSPPPDPPSLTGPQSSQLAPAQQQPVLPLASGLPARPPGLLGGPVLPSQPRLRPCGCLALRTPVCAVGGSTFQNMCWARCFGARIAHLGACRPFEQPASQPSVSPVYELNGPRLPSSSPRPTTPVQPQREPPTRSGAISNNCVCPMVYSPVCAGGRTWSNACVARCAGITNASSCAPAPPIR